MTRIQALRRFQNAEADFYNHIFTANGSRRAILTHQRANFEAKKQELIIRLRKAQTDLDFIK